MALTQHPRRAPALVGTRRTALLVAGDLLAFLGFSALGRRSHGEAAGLDAILQIIETAAPFAIGWLLVAPFLGGFNSEIVTRPRAMLARTSLAWLIALPIGLALRALIRQTGIPLSFAATTFLVLLALLGGWRGAFAWLAARRGATHGN